MSGYGGRNRQRIKEKNYFFVTKEERSNIFLKKRDQGVSYFGKLFLDIATLQKIFIGCGELETVNQQLCDTFSFVRPTAAQKIYNIPGSSFKGTVKTNLLLFLNDTSTKYLGAFNEKTRVFFADFPLSNTKSLSKQKIIARFTPQITPDARDIKLFLKDDDSYSKYSPQDLQHLKSEHFLVIPPGAKFSGQINFHDLSLAELASLILALGCLKDHRFNFKIGGAKNRGMGLIRVSLNTERSYHANSYRHLVFGQTKAFKLIEPSVLKEVDNWKQSEPKFMILLQKIQGAYGHE